MSKDQVFQQIRSLPLSQQVALWVILRMSKIDEPGFSFYSSTFAKLFKPYVKKHLFTNPEEYGKFVGAALSGLMRNKILIRLTGDRNKLWTISDDIKDNLEKFKKSLFETKVYWN